MKTIVVALTASLAIGAFLFAADSPGPRKALELTFNLPGKEVPQQLSQYRGKVIALEFIFTTCPHCQAASKVMTKFQEEYGARGLQVVDIAVNPNADLLVENFVKDYKVGFPVGWAPAEQMTAFMGFGTSRFVVPQLALIDRKGFIRYQTPADESEKWDKLMTEESLRGHIEELLSQGTGSTSAAHQKETGHVAMATR